MLRVVLTARHPAGRGCAGQGLKESVCSSAASQRAFAAPRRQSRPEAQAGPSRRGGAGTMQGNPAAPAAPHAGGPSRRAATPASLLLLPVGAACSRGGSAAAVRAPPSAANGRALRGTAGGAGPCHGGSESAFHSAQEQESSEINGAWIGPKRNGNCRGVFISCFASRIWDLS